VGLWRLLPAKIQNCKNFSNDTLLVTHQSLTLSQLARFTRFNSVYITINGNSFEKADPASSSAKTAENIAKIDAVLNRAVHFYCLFYLVRMDSMQLCLIASRLTSNTTVTSFFMRSNCGDEEAVAFAKMLATLQSLDMSYIEPCSRITHIGATALATALETNTTLKMLILSRNPLTQAAVPALARLLCVNSTLQHVLLSGQLHADCGITDWSAFIPALRNNDTVQWLGYDAHRDSADVKRLLEFTTALHSRSNVDTRVTQLS
jgi:hypothetical protein